MSTFFQQVINGIQLGSIYALIALGYTMVYGVLRLINFAHGDVFMVGAYVGFYTLFYQNILAERLGNKLFLVNEKASMGEALLALLPALLISMLVCALLGLVIERLAYKPLRKAARLTALITAIGVSLLLENVAQLKWVFGTNPKYYPSVTPQGEAQTLHFGGVIVSRDQLVLVIAAGVLMTILWYIVQRTRMGKAMRAVAHDTDAAALMGINTDAVISFTFALGAALAGAAGVLFGALTYAKVLP
ncbi:MAG: branched-chain amino acid ABC transporter permease, partial [bacterium]